MSFRLINQSNPKKTLCMSRDAWFSILDLAEEYGWNPMGTVLQEQWLEPEPVLFWHEREDLELLRGDYSGEQGDLVLLEDSLNLADALERAFIDDEPMYAYRCEARVLADLFRRTDQLRPSVGALMMMVDFCQLGAFCIERCD